ncbi:MAG: sulfotransferase [Pseudomonadota bacterium]
MNALAPDLSVRGRLPSFLLIGATKCGTTSLHDWMTRHPDIFIHPMKEMRFFLPGFRWEKGMDWYRGQFAEVGSAMAWGEASNGYGRGADYPGAPEKIAAAMPDVRLVYVVRDPLKRLISHYRHRLVTGREWRDPAAAIRADNSYVETGRYGAELTRWLRHFDRAQILVLRSERLFAEPVGQLARLAAHLGVPDRPDLPLRAENRATDRTVMPRALRLALGPLGGQRVAKRVAAQLNRLPTGLLPTASSMSVDLPETLLKELRGIYEADRKALAALIPAEDCDWSFV